MAEHASLTFCFAKMLSSFPGSLSLLEVGLACASGFLTDGAFAVFSFDGVFGF
jgi:hypothetical protein